MGKMHAIAMAIGIDRVPLGTRVRDSKLAEKRWLELNNIRARSHRFSAPRMHEIHNVGSRRTQHKIHLERKMGKEK